MVFFGSNKFESGFGGEFQIDAHSIHIKSGFFDEFFASSGNRLEVNVSVIPFFQTQLLYDSHEAFHRIICIFENSGTQEEPFDVISSIEIHREFHHFINRKSRSFHIVTATTYTKSTIVNAMIRKQDFKQ